MPLQGLIITNNGGDGLNSHICSLAVLQSSALHMFYIPTNLHIDLLLGDQPNYPVDIWCKTDWHHYLLSLFLLLGDIYGAKSLVYYISQEPLLSSVFTTHSDIHITLLDAEK